MNYHLLGRTGLRVSELCLGTMTFGEDWGWGAAKDESRRIFDRYAEAGGNFIDTADGYTAGTSEKLVGEFVRAAGREKFVVATKYSFSARPGDANAGGNHRKNLTQALDGSLRRLGLDYVDLYWVHAYDELTPLDELMRALDDAVRAGKILYAGVSDFPAWAVARAQTLAEERRLTPFAALQVEYSLIERTPERELLPAAQALGLTVTPWSPLASGLLTGKYLEKKEGDQTAGDDAHRLEKTPDFAPRDERTDGIVRAVVAVAQELGKSPAQVALNWVRQQPGRPIPILGARKFSQFEDNLACLDWELAPEHLARLDQVSRVPLGFPYDFLHREGVRSFLHGGLWEKVVK